MVLILLSLLGVYPFGVLPRGGGVLGREWRQGKEWSALLSRNSAPLTLAY